MYLNQVYFGHGNYGVEAASTWFFNHPAKELTLPEAALLAGPHPAPRGLLARSGAPRPRRRGATSSSAGCSRSATSTRRPRPRRGRRRSSLSRIGARGDDRALLLRGGPPVPREDLRGPGALPAGAPRRLDARPAPPGVGRGGAPAGPPQARAALRLPQAAKPRRRGDRPREVPRPGVGGAGGAEDEPPPERAVVLSASQDGSRAAREGPARFTLPARAFRFTRAESPAKAVRRGDLVLVERLTGDDGKEETVVSQEPRRGGRRRRPRERHRGRPRARRRLRLLPLEVRPGRPGAPPGRLGLQADRLHDRRSRRASRRPTPSSTRRSRSRSTRGSLPGSPQNYTRKYSGILTYQNALENSINVPAVRVDLLVGTRKVIETARRLGIRQNLLAYPSLALGVVRGDAARDDGGLLRLREPGAPLPAAARRAGPRRRGGPPRGEPARPEGGGGARPLLRPPEDARGASPSAAPAARGEVPRPAGSPGRPGRRTTTPTPGSSASRRSTRSASGSGTTRRRASDRSRPAATPPCRSGCGSSRA